MQSTFVQNSSGSWDLFVNNEPFGVTFEVPDGYAMKDYKFFLSNDEINSVKACKDVIFVLGEPDKMGTIVIDAEANTRFLNGLKVKVEGTLTLGKNFNLALSRNSQEKNPKMPKFNDLIIKNNENTVINFEDRTKKLNSKELNQLNKDGAYPYTRNMVQNNTNLNLSLAVDTKSIYIAENMDPINWWKTPSSNIEHAPSINFHGENSFVAKNIVVFESNNRFVNSKVISHKTLSFKGMSNAIMDSEISFSEKNQSYSEIKDFISRDSTLSDVSGTLTGSINSVKGEEITIKEGGQFNILPANAQETGVSTYLSSVTLEEGSELSIGANGADKQTISLSNVKVSNGNNIVVFSQDTDINNTQLSGVELSIEKNESGKFEVSNSTLANKIVLKNVSSVNLSEIDSSNLSSSTVVAIENEWIKDRITNVLDEILEKKKKGITFEDNSLILKTDKNLELL